MRRRELRCWCCRSPRGFSIRRLPLVCKKRPLFWPSTSNTPPHDVPHTARLPESLSTVKTDRGVPGEWRWRAPRQSSRSRMRFLHSAVRFFDLTLPNLRDRLTARWRSPSGVGTVRGSLLNNFEEIGRFMSNELRNFLALSYDELEQLNLKAKEQRQNRVAAHKIQEERIKYLTDETRIKAVTVLFSDLEGRLHMLDYDKKFLIKSWDNLTFDGSSIRGFTAQRESDLRLAMDWSAFYWAPADVFGAGKVLVFGEVIDKNGEPYTGDLRAVLKGFANERFKNDGLTLNAANEIEGFLFNGVDAEKHYGTTGKFEYVNTGGYYHSLPGDALRLFINAAAEVKR